MIIGVMHVQLHLQGCLSLKEKRRRLARMRALCGRTASIAVCESRFHDDHQRSEWAYVAPAISRTLAHRSLGNIERQIEQVLDASVVSARREFF